MAVDLRIEKFAADTFAQIWFCIKCEDSTLPRPKDYGDLNETDCTDQVLHLIFARFFLFSKMIVYNLENDYKSYSDDGVAFYLYLCKHMAKYIAYREMNVFDKMLMSCAIVAMMGKFCYCHKNLIYRYTGPLSWAMYFERASKEEFYAAGGWTELKKYTKSHNVFLFYPARLKNTTERMPTDVETAKELYKHGEKVYDWCYVIEEFKRRMVGRHTIVAECVSCLNCLPLFHVFYSISYGGKPVVNDFQLVEGYVQLFLRTLTRKECLEIHKNVLEKKFPHNTTEEEQEVADALIKAAYTLELLERIFPREQLDNSEIPHGNEIYTRCVFCGVDTREPLSSIPSSDDSERINPVKSVIQCTVSNVESTKIAGFFQDETTSCGRTSDEIEEKMVLRLFLALGMEPFSSKVKANIQGEIECEYRLQNIGSVVPPKNQNEKESSHQKKTKKKKKKKKSCPV